MNECPIETRLSAYLDRELPEPQVANLEAHLRDCEACSTELASLRAVKELAEGLSAPAVSDEEWAATWSAIEARVAAVGQHRRPARAQWLATAIAAAAVLAIAAGVWARWPHRARPVAALPSNECVVEYVETAPGYSSMYSYSPEADVTIITLVPPAPPEAPPDHESRNPS
jgi:anti-sigma factor RsiW